MKKYSVVKSQYVQKQLALGKTKKEAHRSWCRSKEKTNFEKQQSEISKNFNCSHVDRSYYSPMSDWAESADDF